MSTIQHLLTEHLDIWTAADTAAKSGRGRSAANAAKVYGICKLRELILELAVRGKLVPQDANDEPASELLKRIQAEKAKLVAGGKIRKDKPLPPISDEDAPFYLPNGWQFLRLNDFVLSILSGGTPSKNNSDFWNGKIPWASVKDLNVDKYLVKTQDYITKSGLEDGSKLAQKGDLIICTRMGLGKIAIAAMDVAINQDLKALKVTPLLDIDYFINFYKTLKISGSGMTVAGIRQDELLGYVVPTPPLAEQHRIVAKVDELMALCDQLESEHNNASAAHEQLVNHLLGTLTESTSAEDFSAGWQRIAAHFDTLFTTEASIDTLKQTLLQLAVMGKLVPQDPNDEPASELLKNIRKEKDQLIAEGKIKKDKPLPPITDEERPFALPSGWEWVRLSVFSELKGGMAYQSHSFSESGLNQVIRMGNVRPGKLRLDEKPVYISESLASNTTDYMLDIDDIVLTMTGTIGKRDYLYSARICSTHLNNKKLFLNQRLCSVKNFLMNVSYVNMAMKSDKLLDVIFASATGTANQANIGMLALCSWPIPVPSLAEQHRIVAKVDELMALCDQLKSQLLESGEQQRKLADVLVKNAVA